MYAQLHYALVAEDHLLITVADKISEEALACVQKVGACAAAVFGDSVIDIIPAYTTVMIVFDCITLAPEKAALLFQQHWHDVKHGINTINPQAKTIEIPIYYHPDVGWDLLHLSEQKGIDWQELVQLHHEKTYHVYAMGFSPGFAFMGLLPPRLHSSRKSSPRKHLPQGTLAIADLQTAIYPQASPGGWNSIGRTPVSLFDVDTNPANLLNSGDTVQFLPIEKEAYLSLGGIIEFEKA